MLVRGAGHLPANCTGGIGSSTCGGGGGGGGGGGWQAGRLWTEEYFRRLLRDVSVHVKVAPADGFFEGPEDLALWRGAGGEGRDVPASVLPRLADRGRVVLVRAAEVNMPFPELLARLRDQSAAAAAAAAAAVVVVAVGGGGAAAGSNATASNAAAAATAAAAAAAAAASYYLEYSSIASYTPQLTRDLGSFRWAAFLARGGGLGGVPEARNLWLGGRTLGKLHFDEFENVLAVFDGTKNLTLFAPDDGADGLYEGHMREAKLSYRSGGGDGGAAVGGGAAAAGGGGSGAAASFARDNLMSSTSMVNSPVDIARPDLRRFPRFARARPMRCTVAAGDALYLPAFWWHEVQSTPDAGAARVLATNFWYAPIFTKEFPCAACALDVNPAYLPHLEELMQME